MAKVKFTLNGEAKRIEVDPDMPVLWMLRDVLGLTGTKYGCGIGQCGCCTVHLNGAAVRSCQLPSQSIEGMKITTIESLGGASPHRLQKAWMKENVSQCGYCQAGQLMSAAALLNANPKPSDEAIETHMNGNICRCGTYKRIRKAIKCASDSVW